MAEVYTPDPLLMRFILGHILASGDVPHVHHALIVAAGQVGLQVLVPRQAAELGACGQFLAGAVRLCSRIGHDSAVLIDTDALGYSCCGKDLHGRAALSVLHADQGRLDITKHRC